MSNLTTGRPIRWRLTRAFWARWHVLRYRAAKERPIKAPAPNGRKIGLVPGTHVDREIGLRTVRVFDALPKEEDDPRLRIATALGLWLQRHLPPHFEALPEVPADPHAALDQALTDRHVALFRRPDRPAAFTANGPDLGELALRGPYAILLERTAEGSLAWDFRRLSDFEHHPELCPLGVMVTFEESEGGELAAAVIESDALGLVHPGEPDWRRSRELAVCAATTHVTLTRHFNYVHLVAATHWDVVTRNELPVDHPLYRLLWPHITQGLYTNYGITRSQLSPDGDFVNIFSFTHAGLMAYLDAMYSEYDISGSDPDADWNRRGLVGSTLACDSHRNLSDLFGLMNDHAVRYINTHYPSDDALHADEHAQRWLRALEYYIPNGATAVAGEPLTRAGLSRLIGSFIFEGTTIHDLVGTALWDYQLWSDCNPTRMYRNGQRVPVDVFDRMVNNNFGLQLKRARLLDDYGDHALNGEAAGLFSEFLAEGKALQARYDADPQGRWRMEPKDLEISMNG